MVASAPTARRSSTPTHSPTTTRAFSRLRLVVVRASPWLARSDPGPAPPPAITPPPWPWPSPTSSRQLSCRHVTTNHQPPTAKPPTANRQPSTIKPPTPNCQPSNPQPPTVSRQTPVCYCHCLCVLQARNRHTPKSHWRQSPSTRSQHPEPWDDRLWSCTNPQHPAPNPQHPASNPFLMRSYDPGP